MQTVDRAEVETVEVVDGVHLTQMAAGERMSIQHYHFEPGSGVPLHDHPHEQLGIVFRGSMRFSIPKDDAAEETRDSIVASGESYAIPGGEPHAAVNDGDVAAVGIDVFSPPRLEPPWLTEG